MTHNGQLPITRPRGPQAVSARDLGKNGYPSDGEWRGIMIDHGLAQRLGEKTLRRAKRRARYANGFRYRMSGEANNPAAILRRRRASINGYGNPLYVQREVAYTIRTDRAGTQSFLSEARAAVWSVNSELPVFLESTMKNLYDRSLSSTSFTLVMLTIAGTMALLLGIVGIYGVMSYAVSQRTRELAIRLALGAKPGALKRALVGNELALAETGMAIGLAAAAGLTRLMKSLLFGISTLDPVIYFGMAAVLVAAAVLASYLPARRASRIDPSEALRLE